MVDHFGCGREVHKAICAAWYDEWINTGIAHVWISRARKLPESMATLLLDFSIVRREPLTKLLADLLLVHNASANIFIPEGFRGHCSIDKPVFLQARDVLLASSVGIVLRRLAPKISEYLAVTDSPQSWSLWVRFQLACSQWLYLGALQGSWLLPYNSASFLSTSKTLLPQIAEKRSWDRVLDGSIRTHKWLSQLYSCSTLREIDDTPKELFVAVPKRFKDGSLISVLKVQTLLDSHRKDPPFPYDCFDGRPNHKPEEIQNIPLLGQLKIYLQIGHFFLLMAAISYKSYKASATKNNPLLTWCKEQKLNLGTSLLYICIMSMIQKIKIVLAIF